MADEQQQQNEPKTETALMVPIERTTPMREMLTVLKETGDPDLFKAFAHDIIEREVAAARFGQDGQLARVFAGSGVFDGIDGSQKGVALAMTKIQLGRSWNMQPADSMEAIFFINGRPSVATRYLSAKIQDAGISWDIEWDEDSSGVCTGCHLHLKRWNPSVNRYEPIMGKVNGKDQQAIVSFTKKDADNAVITEKGKQIKLSEKWNFQSWPADMYFARCISRVRTRYASNILSGVLTREEAEDSGTPEVKSAPERAQLTASGFTPSGEQNRGHEAVSENGPRERAPRKPREEKKEEPMVAETKPSHAAPRDPTATQALPWMNEADMKNVLRVLQLRVGPKAYSDALSAIGAVTGDLRWEGGKSVLFYKALKALPDEAEASVPTQAALVDDTF